ncbi:hypothetical protein BC831DRAFT_454429 [Entophlyctis helioformis]|nr:hypothetical protein BC831DRAFT_454429 [Entophlyctis helioformis]
MLYVLQLEHNKFYVGRTERSVEERFLEHCSGTGSNWTSIHFPLRVLMTALGDSQDDENDLTLEIMRRYGWQNVRGGSWCNVDMANAPIFLNESSDDSDDTGYGDTCYRCGRASHYSSECYASTHINGHSLDGSRSGGSSSGSRSNSNNVCYRCGRTSHSGNDCYASTHANGTYLGQSQRSIGCLRCGRTSHNASMCYARTHANGYDL